MTQQWIRDWQLTIDTGQSLIDASDFRIRFEVHQDRLQTPNWAEIIITNLSDETAQKIRKEGQKVTLKAGYVGSMSVIFEGEIIQKRLGRETGTDTYLTILARSGDRAYNHATVNKSLAAGHTFRDQVNVALEAMKPYGITAGNIADLGPAKMPRGAALFGMARDILRDIGFATKTSWYIQGQKLHMTKDDEADRGGAIVLNSMTGLIWRPVQTFDGIIGKCLINPQIVPGAIVKIDEASIDQAAFDPSIAGELSKEMIPSTATDGFYKVLTVDVLGDTRGQPWYCEFICIRADRQGPLPIGLINKGVSLDPAPPAANSSSGGRV